MRTRDGKLTFGDVASEVHCSAMDPRNSDSRGRSNDRAWDVGDPDQDKSEGELVG